jgi:hypothetical protein
MLGIGGESGGASGRPLGSAIARFLKLRGERVFECGGIYWAHYRNGVYISLPFHLQLDPEPEEIDAVLRQPRVACVQFPAAARPGLASGLFVCKPQGYDLKSVRSKYRAQILRGLENCEVRRVDPLELRSEGIHLNRETMKRQARFEPEFGEPERWNRYVDAVRQCPEIEVTGAYVKGRLSAYSVACREDGWLHRMLRMSRAEDFALGASYALDYGVLSAAARQPDIQAVGNWRPSIGSETGVDRYKMHVGFTIAPQSLCTHMRPALVPFLTNRVAVWAARMAHLARPGSGSLMHCAKLLEGARLSRLPAVPQPG